MQDHAPLIKALGDGTAIAAAIWGEAATAKQRDSVYKWKQNGVPWRYRQLVALLAQKSGIELPPNFLLPGHSERPGSSTSLPSRAVA